MREHYVNLTRPKNIGRERRWSPTVGDLLRLVAHALASSRGRESTRKADLARHGEANNVQRRNVFGFIPVCEFSVPACDRRGRAAAELGRLSSPVRHSNPGAFTRFSPFILPATSSARTSSSFPSLSFRPTPLYQRLLSIYRAPRCSIPRSGTLRTAGLAKAQAFSRCRDNAEVRRRMDGKREGEGKEKRKIEIERERNNILGQHSYPRRIYR